MLPHGPSPLCQSRLPVVDLLPTAYQCDNDRPVRLPVHDAEHQGRFGVHHCELVTLIGCCTAEKFLSHFRRVPGALGLVKNNDVFWRKLTCLPVGLEEGVDALNEGAHAPSRFSQALARSAVVIQCKGFSDHFDQRPVAGKESSCRTPIAHQFRAVDGLQTCQRFSRAGNAGDKAHQLAAFALCLPNSLGQNIRGASQIDGFRMSVLDVAHAVVREEHLSGFHDVRNRRVSRTIPCCNVNLPALHLRSPRVCQINQRGSEGGVFHHLNRLNEVVHNLATDWLRRSRHQEHCHGDYCFTPAFFVKIAQLYCVVLDLALGCSGAFRRAGLELQHDDKLPGEKNTINSAIPAWDFVFQQHPPASRSRNPRHHLPQGFPQDRHRPLPGNHGREAKTGHGVPALKIQFAKNRRRVCAKKTRNGIPIKGRHGYFSMPNSQPGETPRTFEKARTSKSVT